MMSLPDFKEKQMLIVHASDVIDERLQFKNDNICFTRDGQIVNQLSCHKVFVLFVIGDFTITSVLIRNCEQYGVSLFLLKDNFLQYASLVSVAEGNYLLREKQFTSTRDFDIAQHIVANKLLNQKILLGEIQGKKTNKEWQKIIADVREAKDGKQLLGVEGSATKQYFPVYFKEMNWYRRMPRAKVDEINLLMDIGYTMLFNFVDALIGLYGFDSYKGVYHTLFFQRKSLVCDLVEPFRCIIDRQILKSFHLKQIDKKDFLKQKDKYLLSYEKQKKYVRIFSDAIMDQKESMFCYVRDYYYCIMNDTEEYPIFYINT
ncbi:MAG: hypothetical protein ACD_48C00252G0002 [uncultured bacterium]|nr:MAG: hypothetical protein ACD_48C00252G0002 [uncultured bacterium]